MEYEALGENFHNRGRRSEEQIEVLRLLWTRELVTFEGQWHRITEAGINPLPVQRPIPIWFGGSAEPVLERVARLGDGWFPLNPPTDKCRAMIEKIRSCARTAGRDPTSIGIVGRIVYADSTPDQWAKGIKRWQEFGATHVCLNTMKAGLSGPIAHIEAIRRFKQTLGEMSF